MDKSSPTSGVYGLGADCRPWYTSAMEKVIAMVLVALTTVRCGQDTQLELRLLDSGQCDRYCVDTLEVAIEGQGSTSVPCGEFATLDLGSDDATTVTITTVGLGSPLRAEVEILPDAADAQFVLMPVERPQITSVASESPYIFDATEVVIEGQNLGPRAGEAEVRIGGIPVRQVLAWTNERIVVETDRAGEVDVRRCGVSGTLASLTATEARLQTLPIRIAGCEEARLAAADGLSSAPASVDSFLGAFACGADCSATVLARVDGSTGEIAAAYEAIAECPFDVAVSSDPSRGYLAYQEGIQGFALDTPPRLTRPDELAFRFNKISVASGTFAALAGRRNIPWIWRSPDVAPERAFSTTFAIARDVDGPYMVGLDDSNVARYARIRETDIEASADIACGSPRAIARANPGPNRSNRVIVACDQTFDVFENDVLSRQGQWPLNAGQVLSAATTRDGNTVLALTTANTLLVAGVEQDWAATVTLPPRSGEIASQRAGIMIRTPRSDRFYITGPTFGTVTSVDLTP